MARGHASGRRGGFSVSFPNLPADAREDSLRLLAKGPPGTKLFEVQIIKSFTPQAAEKRTQQLQKKIQALADKKAELGDKIMARQSEIAILKAIGTQGAQRAGSDSIQRPGAIADFTTAAAALGERFALLLSKNRADQKGQRTLDEEILALRRKLAQIGQGRRESQTAVAELELASDGKLEFELTYQVATAGWRPVYDLRLETRGHGAKVLLAFGADVRQNSGQDWTHVDLILSTARPTQGLKIPDPSQWWLDFYRVPQPRPRRRAGRAAPAPSQALEAKSGAIALADSSIAERADIVMAQTVTAEFATTFVIPRARTIASDNSAHRVGIVETTSEASLALVSVPRLVQAAFIEAKIQHQGEQPLLAGSASLFRDGEYVGSTALKPVAPGETFTLGFGRDDRIKIERKLMRQKSSQGSGFWGGKGKREYRWVTSVQNFHSGPRTVEIREQLPRSRQKDIVVSVLELDPKPLAEDPDQPKLIRWRLGLKPKEKAQILFSYRVKYPDEARVSGLE